jgi:predicted TIM-barrel enzyme
MSSLPDALLVSGSVTGIVAKMNLFKEVKENAGEVPVLANTGVTSETVEDILKEVDGVIIGTAFKVDGITWNPVSQERVNKLMQKVSSLRKNLKK